MRNGERWGYVRAAALKPAQGLRPCTPCSLRGGKKKLSAPKIANLLEIHANC